MSSISKVVFLFKKSLFIMIPSLMMSKIYYFFADLQFLAMASISIMLSVFLKLFFLKILIYFREAFSMASLGTSSLILVIKALKSSLFLLINFVKC